MKRDYTFVLKESLAKKFIKYAEKDGIVGLFDFEWYPIKKEMKITIKKGETK